MQAENLAREAEIAELRDLLAKARAELAGKMDEDKDQMINRLEKENKELKDKLADEKNNLQVKRDMIYFILYLIKTNDIQGNIDGNHNQANKRINELAEKLSNQLKSGSDAIKDLTDKMIKENALLRSLMSQPLSIYFDAFRTEDYELGGEEYLTFSGTKSNLGGGMDAKSGVFTAPQCGAYMFTIHICTHDMKKGLLSLRCNGNELASFYDQNHDSNHKNSMVGQSVVVEVGQGDKIQVYMYTHTGIMDKRSNWLTHFIGVFLRPKDFMKETESLALTNGH